ncbi:hypothetical protein BDZ89DRAFT_1164869 [Hymenopellis radicata]|nr:hypothetical protein BDZ89DRAFT_1164869 [Hymenopellis radicata]
MNEANPLCRLVARRVAEIVRDYLALLFGSYVDYQTYRKYFCCSTFTIGTHLERVD